MNKVRRLNRMNLKASYCSTKPAIAMQALSDADAMLLFGEAILKNSARSATLHKAFDKSSKTSTIRLFL